MVALEKGQGLQGFGDRGQLVRPHGIIAGGRGPDPDNFSERGSASKELPLWRKQAVIMHSMLKTSELVNPNAGATT